MRGVATQRLRDAIAEHPDIYDMDIMPAESFRNEKFITVGLRNQIAKAREAGIDLPVARTILITGMSEDEIWVNMSRVNGVDPTDPGSYTRGEIEARKQVYRIRKYLRQFVPGFENAWMDRVAPFMGIRESRVTVGKYVLTAEGYPGLPTLRRRHCRSQLSRRPAPSQRRGLHAGILRRLLRHPVPGACARKGRKPARRRPLRLVHPRSDGLDTRDVDLHGPRRSRRTRRTHRPAGRE